MYRRLRFILSILAVALVLRHSGAAQSQSWQIVSGLPSSVAVADILVVSNAEIYVALRTQGVRRTTDGGANWQVLNSGIEGLNAVRLGRTGAGDIIVSAQGSTAGVFRLQSGQTWRHSDLPAVAVGLALNRRNEVVAYSQSIAYRSSDGDHFVRGPQVNTGLGQVLESSPAGDLYVGTEGAGVFRSADNGDSWQNIGDKVNGTAFGFSAHGDILYAERAAVWRYTGGTTWARSDTGLPNSPRVYSFVTSAAGQIFAGYSGAVYVSNDDGRSWQNYGVPGLPSTFIVASLARDAAGQLYAGAGENGGGLYRTSSGAVTAPVPPPVTPAKPGTPTNLRIVP